MLAAAVASALALAGCADLPGVKAEDVAGSPGTTAPAAQAAPARSAAPATAATPQRPAQGAAPTNTVTLPDRGRVSLAEYRAQMRDQLMKTEGAAPDVADCAAHASWVVPRSPIFDALKIPTGALGSGQATVEPWSGRFSQGKQAVPVSQVVTFAASAHKRSGEGDWQPVRVRCGYDDGMMLAYELLDAGGTSINEPAAAPAVGPTHCTTTKNRKGKMVKHCRSSSAATSDVGSGSGSNRSSAKGQKSSAKSSAKSPAKSSSKTASKSTSTKSTASGKKKTSH